MKYLAAEEHESSLSILRRVLILKKNLGCHFSIVGFPPTPCCAVLCWYPRWVPVAAAPLPTQCLTTAPGEETENVQVHGPLKPSRRPATSSGFLASVWPSSCHCAHLGNEAVHGRLSSCFSSSLFICTFQINDK